MKKKGISKNELKAFNKARFICFVNHVKENRKYYEKKFNISKNDMVNLYEPI
jgi:phenylacetate-coenzyme A ligase PaaK-like adenylate-forming protein